VPATSTSATHAVGVRTTTLWRTPESPRPLDAPMLGADPDPRAWAAAQDRAARLALDGVADTQLLLGEPVEVVEERAGWARVVAPWQPSEQDPRGYPGWVPSAHLTTPPAASDEEAVVLVDTAILRQAPGGTPVLDDVSYATVLPVAGQSDGSALVHLPGGGQAWLDGASCLVRKSGRDATVDATAVLDEARRFVGLDYLWSGMCVFGLDCSGLVHISFRALGLVVPRDAKDQAVAASSVPLDEVEAGDLLFFAKPGEEIHHVAFATGAKDVILHAPGTGNPVEEAPLSDRRKSTLTSAGRLTG
jgi:gamma-D-glutamyl-L-lysine dipeptidyl-peptidase